MAGKTIILPVSFTDDTLPRVTLPVSLYASDDFERADADVLGNTNGGPNVLAWGSVVKSGITGFTAGIRTGKAAITARTGSGLAGPTVTLPTARHRVDSVINETSSSIAIWAAVRDADNFIGLLSRFGSTTSDDRKPSLYGYRNGAATRIILTAAAESVVGDKLGIETFIGSTRVRVWQNNSVVYDGNPTGWTAPLSTDNKAGFWANTALGGFMRSVEFYA